MLELQHVSYEVEEDGEKKQILKDINLTIEDGTFLVVTGPNGGGKSSLAKVIMGINKVSGHNGKSSEGDQFRLPDTGDLQGDPCDRPAQDGMRKTDFHHAGL